MTTTSTCLLVAAITACAPVAHAADDPAPEAWNAKFQATYIRQVKPAMHSPYAGPNSLVAEKEWSYSFTATAALGARLWPGGEAYFNAEAAQGVPLSGLTGLGGFTNGEMARSSGAQLKAYRARLFARQTIGLGGEGTETLESAANQLGGSVPKNRLVLTLGNLAAIDIFDRNAYSHDARTQFMNWSLLTHGAYDFAADARGYSWGAAGELMMGDWAVRVGRFAVPKLPNQQSLDDRIRSHYGDQLEIEHGHDVLGRPGRVRLLAFRMRARMSRFQDAIDLGARTGSTPDIDLVRTGNRSKTGWGVNLEQELSADLGGFLRWSAADGKTETYAFTEIDRSLSGGVLVKGGSWGRADDTVGLAFARNGLSGPRRDYLSRGGIGFFIGDGRLNYASEQVIEAFYNLQLMKSTTLGLDLQRIAHPAYNADRGPATFVALRLHSEF